MKKLTVTKKAEINELDIEAFNGEILEEDIKDVLKDIKFLIETDEEINSRFWKYVVDYAIKKVVSE